MKVRTKKERARALKLYESGMKIKDIIAETGICVNTLYRWVNGEDVREVYSAKLKDKTLKLREKGMPMREIANKLGISFHTVAWFVREDRIKRGLVE